ncbi:MAG: gamma-glutamyltransferase 1 [Rickettsiaceae bacterium]|jgi:gamma-glutamyltranspeptidase/glutathione hydrolase|nr:gamma-glutamyltransferase 1 [Rickettsiaceae bacterium]
MTKNQTKISSLILFIVVLIGWLCYESIDFKKFRSQPVANNDVWSGEPFSYFRDLKTVSAKKYLISTSHEMASQVGKEILEKGGNAIDAAIASQMVLNVVEPQSSGIGGGAFLLYYDAKTKTTHYFNGRETAPAAANDKIFLDEKGQPRTFNDVVKGGLSVGTPGLLKLLKEVHEKYGKLKWEEVFEPAIMVAKRGFPMDERIQTIAKNVANLKDSESFAKLYLKEDGTPKDLGTIITNPALAKTFSTIAKSGIKPFYEGKIAEDIVDAVKNSPTNPGYLSLTDLKNYKIKEGELICANYRVKYKVCSMPLPSSGGIAMLQILGILENFDLSKLQPSSVEAIHLIAEATRLGYADRNKYVADIANVPVEQMLDKEYLKSRSELIDMRKAMSKAKAGEFAEVKTGYVIDRKAVELPSTTHISIVDAEGNAIAMTSSIEYYFGSVLNVDGFMLNNQLTDFSFAPEIDGKPVANRLEPGKQPRSSMSPTFVFDENDNLIMVVGSPGGPRIIQFVLKTIIAHLDWGLDIQKAISLPNFVVLNDEIELEKRTDLEKLQSKLEDMGHKVKISDLVSGIHAITIKPNGLEGGADPRRGGVAIGE